ncbi:MAG: VCBS repeat-containing protein, partial [Pirellulaceae bacterium]
MSSTRLAALLHQRRVRQRNRAAKSNLRLLETLEPRQMLAGFAGEVLSLSPDAYWRFEETLGGTVSDSVSGQVGTVFTATLNADGPQSPLFAGLEFDNNALDFNPNDGSIDYVSFGDNFIDNETELSVATWIKVDSLNKDNTIMGKGAFAGGEPILFWRDDDNAGGPENNTIAVLISDANTETRAVAPDGSLNDTGWHHVAFTFTASDGDGDGQGLKLYIDGAMVATANTANVDSIKANNQPLTVGGVVATLNQSKGFDGAIDEVVIANAVYSPTEIQALYEAGVNPAAELLEVELSTDEDTPFSFAPSYADVVRQDDPVLYWRLGEDAATKSGGGTTANAATGPSSIGAAGDGTYAFAVADVAGDALTNSVDSAASFGTTAASGSTGDTVSTAVTTFLSNVVTTEFWMRSSSTQNQQAILSYATTNAQNNELLLFKNGAGIFLYVNSVNAATGLNASDLYDGDWHHVAISWESSTGTTLSYLDGQLAATATIAAGQTIDPNGTFMLAQEQDTVGGGFDNNQKYDGELDEVAIYNRALDSAEVGHHYLSNFVGQAGTVSYPQAVASSDPLIYWDLGESAAAKNSGGTAVNKATGQSSLATAGDGSYTNAVGNVADTAVVSSTGASYGSTTAINSVGDSTQVALTAFPTTALTAEVWVRSSSTANQQAIISYDSPGGGNRLLIFKNGNNIVSYINNSAVNTGLLAADLFNGQWNHLAVTWQSSGGTLSTFLNGALVNTITNGNNATIPAAGTLALAQEQDSPGGGFANGQKYIGDLDDFALYDRVLTPAEIATHFSSAGNGGTFGISGFDATTALGAEVSIDGSGILTYDSTATAALQSMTTGDSMTDSFSYTFSDGNGNTDTATISIDVAGVEDLPVASDEAIVVGEDETFVSGAAPAAPIIADDPLIYWPLDEAVGTKSGGGVATNAATGPSSFGTAGDGDYFNSVQDVADVGVGGGTGASFGTTTATGSTGDRVQAGGLTNFPSTALTASVWLRADDLQDQQAILSYDTSASNRFLLFKNGSAFQVFINNLNLTTGLPIASLFNGQWNHVAVTWDSASGELNTYLNGEIASSTTHSQGGAIPIGGTLVLGQEQDSQGGGFVDTQKFIGDLDEFALYDTVLDATQIRAQVATGLNLVNNDTDADGDTITVSASDATSVAGANVVVNANGTFTYDATSVPGFQLLAVGQTAADSFTYTISDGKGNTDIATVAVTVVGKNDAPVANPDGGDTDEDSVLSFGQSAADVTNASDPIFYWRLGEAAAAKSGGGIAVNAATGPSSLGAAGDGTYGGAVADVTTGVSLDGDTAARFGATTATGSTGDFAAVDLPSMPQTAFTSTMWVRSSSNQATQTLFSYAHSSTHNELLLLRQAGQIGIFVGT